MTSTSNATLITFLTSTLPLYCFTTLIHGPTPFISNQPVCSEAQKVLVAQRFFAGLFFYFGLFVFK